MPDGITVRVEGLAELKAKMKRLGNELSGKTLKSAVAAAAKVIKEEASLRAPVDTGSLRDAVRVGFARQESWLPYKASYNVFVRHKMKKYAQTSKNVRSGRAGKSFRDFGTLFYWMFVEFGTSKMPAKPFMRPAFESKKGEALEKFKATLKSKLQKLVPGA